MENSIPIAEQLDYLLNIPNHWFKSQLNKDENFDKLGVHHKSCNGTNIENKSYSAICCGSTYCYYCNTVMHGCTDNECFYKEKYLIKCHRFCLENAKKKIK